MDSDSEEDTTNLFKEPDGYYQKEKEPTQVEHRTVNGQVLRLNLVGQNPLWVGASCYFLIEQGGEEEGWVLMWRLHLATPIDLETLCACTRGDRSYT